LARTFVIFTFSFLFISLFFSYLAVAADAIALCAACSQRVVFSFASLAMFVASYK